MENIKKSKRVALGIIEDAKEIINVDLDVTIDVEGAVPSTSNEKAKRPKEIVKYDRITFNTTAVLHHYPQITENENKKASKKSDLNLPLVNSENNNGIQVSNKKDNVNNNKAKVNEDDKIGLINESLKFAEEKLEFNPPNSSVLTAWLVIASGVVISMVMLAVVLWRFSCFEDYTR
ncbi:Uncharacterized protein OBRU01_22039 [Operophtera brumata]|uniref:Uncharacterized protein n=1 Tax=Operophtera brumata TaxID=104452 RepID=A0A0L7KTC9_OPEBR|nr:Uncharacterized protein OBRU01_22039 [Operophtera brumata]